MYRFFTVVLLSCSLLLPVYAAEKQEEIPADPWAFELSVQPKKTEAELEAERWTLLMSRETGNYLNMIVSSLSKTQREIKVKMKNRF